MRYGLSFLTALAWGLWLGGLMTLFLTVTRLFAVNRPAALVAAPEMFITFERYQLFLAAGALVATVVWRLTEPREALTILFCLFALAAIPAIINAVQITPKMEALRLAGQSSGPVFKALHGQSMALFTLEAIALLLAGTVIVWSISERPRERAVAIPEAPACA